MTNYALAKNFIKEHHLTKKHSYEQLIRIAQYYGYTIYEWYPNYSKDSKLFELLKCSDVAYVSEAFSYISDTKKIIFIKKLLTEKEKKSALLHELIHIYMGHLVPGKKISVLEEKQATDIHHTIDLILNYETTVAALAFTGFATICLLTTKLLLSEIGK